MALAFTNVFANGMNNDLSDYTTTPTLTVVAGRFYLAVVTIAWDTGTPTLSSLTGAGVTWTGLAGGGQAWNAASKRIHILGGVAPAGATEALTLTASSTLIGIQIIVDEVTGAAGTVLQATPFTGSSTTLAALASANNAVYGGFGGTNNSAAAAGTGLTGLGAVNGGNPNRNTFSAYDIGGDVLTVAATGLGTAAGIALEIVAAVASGHGPLLGRNRLRLVRP